MQGLRAARAKAFVDARRSRVRWVDGSIVAMPVTMHVPPVPVGVMAAATHVGHGDPARFTELCPFSHHARSNPVRVGNELGAKPQRIGRAGLARFRAALLGSSNLESGKKCADRQCQAKHETHGTHRLCSPFARAVPAATHTSGESAGRRWSTPVGRFQSTNSSRMRRTRPQRAPQAKFLSLRVRSLGRLAGHGSTAPSVRVAVSLSNARRRQNDPSGIE
jgi:hypothetical protein